MTWRIHMWNDLFIAKMPHLYVACLINTWHASWIRNMPHSCMICLIHVWHASFIYDTTHSHATRPIHLWHDPFICDMTSYVTEGIHTWENAFIGGMPRTYLTESGPWEWGLLYRGRTVGNDLGTYRGLAIGWLRSVGSIKWKVSFAEHRLFYRALLQKRPII